MKQNKFGLRFTYTSHQPPCNPCKYDNRHPGCHDTCPDYKAWKAEKEMVMRKRRKEIYDKEEV